MRNYDQMIRFQKLIDDDIRIIQDYPGSKQLTKKLIQLQEDSRNRWAIIHSIFKQSEQTKNPAELSQIFLNAIAYTAQLNLAINNRMNNMYEYCLKKQSSHPHFMTFLNEEVYYSYSFLLDAIHSMGSYYIIADTFPIQYVENFIERKMVDFPDNYSLNFEEPDDDEKND